MYVCAILTLIVMLMKDSMRFLPESPSSQPEQILRFLPRNTSCPPAGAISQRVTWNWQVDEMKSSQQSKHAEMHLALFGSDITHQEDGRLISIKSPLITYLKNLLRHFLMWIYSATILNEIAWTLEVRKWIVTWMHSWFEINLNVLRWNPFYCFNLLLLLLFFCIPCNLIQGVWA